MSTSANNRPNNMSPTNHANHANGLSHANELNPANELDHLLHKAQTVPEETTARPRRWARLWPVYITLRTRGYSCQRAVQWLQQEGAIPPDETQRALNAFHILATRRNKGKGGSGSSKAGESAEAAER